VAFAARHAKTTEQNNDAFKAQDYGGSFRGGSDRIDGRERLRKGRQPDTRQGERAEHLDLHIVRQHLERPGAVEEPLRQALNRFFPSGRVRISRSEDPATTFVVAGDVMMEDRGAGGLPVEEFRNRLARESADHEHQ